MFSGVERIRPLAALVARLVLGIIMVAHGSQKIFPAGALYRFVQSVQHLGLPPALGYVAAFTELFGGAFIILGLLVHLAALGIAVDMAVAIFKVHLHHGLTGPGGYEFPLACFALAVVLMGTGPGYVAADRYVFRGR
jgi:putative oxidoreductase